MKLHHLQSSCKPSQSTFRVQATASEVNKLDADFVPPLGQHDVVWLHIPVAPVLVQLSKDLESITATQWLLTKKSAELLASTRGLIKAVFCIHH